jgi:hypothetical protein
MKRDPADAALEHRIADLRTRYPGIERVLARIERGPGHPAPYAVRLDIRCPQQQTLLSGPLCLELDDAARAAFEAAAARLQACQGRRRK